MDMNNMGKFRISRYNLEREPDELAAAIRGFLPVHVECLHHYDAMEYIGMHADFDSVEMGELIPEYDLIVGPLGGGTFVRRTDGVIPRESCEMRGLPREKEDGRT